MLIIFGLLFLLGMVFGGYILSGGTMHVILHALPFEGMMVGGAAIGALVMANSFPVVKGAIGAVVKAIKGPKWKPSDYTDLLRLLHELARLYALKGAQGIERHIEEPDSSDIFQKYPKIIKDHEAKDLIVDSFRMVLMDFRDPYETEDTINRKLEAHHEHVHKSIHALNNMGDGLPAIGIVAAVLGVVKTMASVDKPPAILGMMIGGALVGTFLGVFLAYCVVMPIAQRAAQVEEDDAAFGSVIRDVIVSIVKGHAAGVCVEVGRGNIPPAFRPTFESIEAQIKAPA